MHNLKNWTWHGEAAETPLLADTFPKSDVHFLVGADTDGFVPASVFDIT